MTDQAHQQVSSFPGLPVTHQQVTKLHLSMTIRHSMSEKLLTRAIHSLLDVVPNGMCWEWAANVDVNNINDGVDPIFDAIQQKMNSHTTFQYDVTWGTKPVFVWIVRQLHYIAKYGLSQFKTLYKNIQLEPSVEGFWMADKTLTA